MSLGVNSQYLVVRSVKPSASLTVSGDLESVDSYGTL